MMDYGCCIICQKATVENLRCPASNSNQSVIARTYSSFIEDWERFRNAGVTVDVQIPIPEATVDNLVSIEAKWHKNCRRDLRLDRLERMRHTSQKRRAESPVPCASGSSRRSRGLKHLDSCLFCMQPEGKSNLLHSFQKVELTEELRGKALLLNDSNVFTQLSLGDVVSNELKYHTYCLVSFNRRFESARVKKDDHDDNETCGVKILEEILGMVEEDLAAGRRYFTLKALYQEMTRRAQLYNTAPMNRTRLKTAILQRFSPMLKEEEGFRNEIILVSSKAMKDLVQSSLVSTAPSEDYRMLSKAALICRRDMSKHGSYDFLKDGFTKDSQKDSVADNLKFLIGLIMYGPSHEDNVENEQSTLSIAQLITFNTHTRQKLDTPLPVYLGLLVHSKFRSEFLVNELHSLGLSVNYNRVKYLERKMGNAVLQQFNAEGLVCPTEMRNGLFTVAAVDNIDHNPSSRTSKDSFHGTAISLFQARRDEADGVKREFPIPSGAPNKLLRLPDQFVTIPQLVTGLNVGPRLSSEPEAMYTDVGTENGHLSEEIRKEEEWAKFVAIQIDDHRDQDDLHTEVTWSAYHGKHQNEVVPCLSGMFPLFKESSSDPRMILHAMESIIKCVNHLNPDQIPVITGDQPVYAIMKKLQWSHESVKEIVVMLGGFHTEKHSAKAIGDILQESGWTQALIEAGVASPGTADAMLKAAHVTKARYAHQVTYVALRSLLHEAHQESAPAQVLDDWLQKGCDSPTFAFWVMVMRLEALLMTFVRAHRERNFELYVESLRSLGELFFACDHYHYARWVTVHVHDMKQVPSSIFDEFMNGRFTVKRSNKRFSSIAIDQGHEQLNKKLKGDGGVIGLTQDPIALVNWSVCGPEVNKRLEEFKMTSGSVEDDSDCDHSMDFFHHDEMVKRQGDFLSDVKNMTDVIRKSGNPFLESGNELVSLMGQISDDKESVAVIMEKGKQQYESFLKDILIGRIRPFETPINKNSFLLFKAPKRKRVQTRKLGLLRANTSLLGQMYIATQTRKGDIDEFFAHESQEYPPSIANNVEKMYHSKKSDVLDCLQKEVDANESLDVVSPAQSTYHAVILDGGALIHSLLPRAGALTFADYLRMCFLRQMEIELRKTSQLHVVWDSYSEYSIKSETRDDRGRGVRLKVGPNVRLPKDWSAFLCQPENKVELFRYLSEEALTNLEGTQYDFYITNGEVVQHVGPGNNMSERCDHEEADTRIVVHVLHALKENARTVLVRTVDSDVVVILIHHFSRFIEVSEDCIVSVSFGSGKTKRLIDVGQMSKALGPDRSLALPLWYALTGCDSTSSLRGRSKRMAYNVWRRCPESVTEAMMEIMEHPFTLLDLKAHQFNTLECFFINLYASGVSDTINGLRKVIFCHRNQNPEMLPPTQDSLLQHCRRAVYQASIWACAHKAEVHSPDPCQHGWKQHNNRLLPVWMTIPMVSAACQVLVKCACKRTCSKACSCVKILKQCTGLCKCACAKT